LNDLNERQILELKPAGVLNVYKITKQLPKSPGELEKLVDAIYSVVEKREQEALQRTEEMLHLISSNSCFSRSLAQHFGDELPHGKKECGTAHGVKHTRLLCKRFHLQYSSTGLHSKPF